MAKGVADGGFLRHWFGKDGSLSTQEINTVSALLLAKVTRVDQVKMMVDLVTLTGDTNTHDNVPLSFGNAGARHFIGAIPQCGDTCVIGYAPRESGRNGQPYIVAWVVPGVSEGYDWLTTQPFPPSALGMSPRQEDALLGAANRVRHKLRLLEEGDVFVSSGSGADLLLSETALLTNRRGNEVILRDQDQAVVVRSLQQFHAGAGFRVYAGMVQRDAALPTQMFNSGSDWNASRQVNAEGVPLSPFSLGGGVSGQFTPAQVFQGSPIGYSAALDPFNLASRGRYTTPSQSGGELTAVGGADKTYGGKKIFRLATDGSNAVSTAATRAFAEYRVEVAASASGTLPVTEQTDSVDIDRLSPSAPVGTDSDPSNRSPDSAMVEMVLGTAVGNDPFNEFDAYRKPLKAVMFQENGEALGSLQPADPVTELADHLAFLVRVHNPVDPTAPPAFMGITKGGAWKRFFPGAGSAGSEEYFQSGHKMAVGKDTAGLGLGVQSQGTISLVNQGSAPNNVGVQIASTGGAVEISAGGSSSEGAGDPVGTESGDTTPNAQQLALTLASEKSSLWRSTLTANVKAQSFVVDDCDTTTINTNTQFAVQSGSGASIEGKTVDISSNGKFSLTCGGPKDGLFLYGAPCNISSIANPVTGFPGGPAVEVGTLFGNVEMGITTVGQIDGGSQVGGCSFSSFGIPPIVPAIPLPGVTNSFGVPGIGSRTDVNPVGVVATAFQGLASMTALAGAATITSTLAAAMTAGVQVAITAPRVSVFCAGLPGGVLTDMCIDSLTGMPFMFGGTIGTPGFRVNS